jgi:site-specific DNA-methyltransferase (adenine-specific)
VSGNEPSSKTNNVFGKFDGRPATAPRVDLDTSAARFFYCPKASPADRHEGLDRPGPQFKKGTTLRKVQVAAAAGELTGNTHPTVKPTELMAYLCRLVTPPGGTVLDPFMGSGSTGKAAMREGFNFIGIELEAAYVAIADARIKHELLKQAPPPADERQLDLLSSLSGF